MGWFVKQHQSLVITIHLKTKHLWKTYLTFSEKHGLFRNYCLEVSVIKLDQKPLITISKIFRTVHFHKMLIL